MRKLWLKLSRPAGHRLSIRREWPLAWRIGVVVVLVCVTLGLAAWIYDAGRRSAGFHEAETRAQIEELTQSVGKLSRDLDAAQRIADTGAARLQMEVTTQEKLAGMVKSLEDENARLKADIAVFESLAGADRATPTLVISRVDVRPDDATGRYRYRMLVAKSGADSQRDFNGHLEFMVTVRRGVQTAIIKLPSHEFDAAYEVSFRYFKRLEGIIQLPQGDIIESVEAKLVEAGRVRASQMFRP